MSKRSKAYLIEQPLEAMFTTIHQKSLISREIYEQLGLDFRDEKFETNEGTPVLYPYKRKGQVEAKMGTMTLKLFQEKWENTL